MSSVRLSRVGANRHVVHGARSFRKGSDGSLTVTWPDGTTSWHQVDEIEKVDERPRTLKRTAGE